MPRRHVPGYSRGLSFVLPLHHARRTPSCEDELIFHVFSALAQFERRLIQERTKAGIIVARARGRVGGRPPIRPTDAKVVLARKLFGDPTVDIDDICSTLKMSRTTLYRYVTMGGGTLER
jgi:DNA invertase Pin-like site-specific DNA recombinase